MASNSLSEKPPSSYFAKMMQGKLLTLVGDLKFWIFAATIKL
eukprot:CAMPEP_0170548550 /NCGR_PEP_ID=MMETSP0211-20121228/6844_1 /TAXON_ID=311385 /ORGANISM="Pseudokeronopsis sp., Strain OXSARD2" /LENGTH=41 /DNA_ID= /DNA_START= /DNA_END= /DNA_ORIENTATION=